MMILTCFVTVIFPYMKHSFNVIGNITIVYFALYIIAILDMCNLNFERKYVPKSRRWNRLNKTRMKILESVRNSVCPISSWLSEIEEDWSEYYKRVPEVEYKEARRRHLIAESLNEGYSPLTRTVWRQNQVDFKRQRKRKYNHVWRCQLTKIHGMESLFANSTTNSAGDEIHENCTRFDTDSGRVGIDNRASACISHDISDFVGSLKKVNRAIKGFGMFTQEQLYGNGTTTMDSYIVSRFLIPTMFHKESVDC